MRFLLSQLNQNPALQSILSGKSELGNVSLSEEAILIASAFDKNPQTIFIVKNNLYSARRLYERLSCLTQAEVLLFSVEESLRVESIASSPEQKANQVEVLAKILEKTPKIVIMNAAAAIYILPSPTLFQEHCINLKVNEEFSYENLKKLLYESGYEHVSRVDQPLCYAARGGIIDVYSMNYDYPIRIEFFDNEIDSIRFFDISSQRTIEVINEVTIIPASDLLFNNDEIAQICAGANQKLANDHELTPIIKEQLMTKVNDDLDAIVNYRKDSKLYRYRAFCKNQHTIFDYFNDAMCIISSKEEVAKSIKHIHEENIAYIQELYQEGLGLLAFQVFADLQNEQKKVKTIEFFDFVNVKKPIQSQILSIPLLDISFDKIMEELIQQSSTNKVVLCLDEKDCNKIRKVLDEQNINYHLQTDEKPLENGITLYEHPLIEGMHCTLEHLYIYTSKELFRKPHRISKYSNKFKEAEVLHDFQELNVGDYVVHIQHGIGKYLGIVNKEIDGIHKDFLHIAYKGDDVLLVPLEQFQLVRKFVSKEGATPRLNKLGSNEWEKTKKKVSEKVAQLAQRLVQLYASRDEHIGHAFAKDSEMQGQFEQDFPYELTKDQQQAVDEIKKDMENDKPMDRLLCGDVGFGKTEVAARAAFKAVYDNKQVAFLCPTTILSLQHYKTFLKRFENFPVRIEVVNRFIPMSKQKQIMEDLYAGNIDILIGTHRLLSKDIHFKDLGLLVIDEEQRFGVEHKEKIKELKNSVDVLSLSATPIPRTLQMSLIGIRSLSQLNTPPRNRMSVQTYVIEKNFGMIKEIIERELARDGQVFYLYNNVKEIYNLARKLRTLLPDVNIGVAHGQMSREDIEDVMMQFTNNQYHVLVCTTIIETGIDIPNANTIIIEDADHFGLSQLYQIKGRVGRSDRLAYAYLMYSPQKQLSEVATKRLKSIKEFTQLGSGYKIAMRDLTIRGAGDMLGPQQAGFIDTVGIDMYIEMLNDAIKEQKGIPKQEKVELTKANVKLDAYLPQTFANEDYEKITLYQRMEQINSKKELLELMDEIKDNYGKLPKSVELLFEKKRLDICINEPHVESFKEYPREVEITFKPTWSNSIDGVKLFEIMTTINRDLVIRYKNQRIIIKFPKRKNWLYIMIEVLEQTCNIETKQ